MCDRACSRACVQTDFPSQIVLPSGGGGGTVNEGRINLQDPRRSDIRCVVSNQKGRTDKQASSWASTGQMSLGNHLIAS